MEKEEQRYGYRWMAKETSFSSIKRMFGEYVSATRFQTGKRDDNKDIIVQSVYKTGLARIDMG